MANDPNKDDKPSSTVFSDGELWELTAMFRTGFAVQAQWYAGQARDDPNRKETEDDGFKAGTMRREKVRQLSRASRAGRDPQTKDPSLH